MLPSVDDARGDAADVPAPSKDRRWDIDERGHGIAAATAEARRIRELAAHAESSLWVAEDPDAHLWPHLQRAIEAADSPWRRSDHRIDADGRLVVDLVHAPIDGVPAKAVLRSAVLWLIGQVAEGATFIEIGDDRGGQPLVVDVVTGMLDDQTPFRTHGHTLRFRVTAG